MKPKTSNRLNLSVQYACNKEGLPLRADFVRWARAALVGGGEVTIRLVEADEGQTLNSEYRGKDYATNVLSFPYDTEPLVSGDLVICPSVVAREAAEQNKAVDAHYAHLTVHGMLHLNAWNIDALAEIEKETGKKVFTILQLRLHPAIVKLKEKIDSAPAGKKYKVDLKYITARGHWYNSSWKGDIQKSGAITSNIGIHFFDMLLWIFGGMKESNVVLHNKTTATGVLELEKACINWMLSIEARSLPEKAKMTGLHTYRVLTIDGEPVEFSDGFQELHTKSYQEIEAGRGFDINENRAAIELVHQIRSGFTEI